MVVAVVICKYGNINLKCRRDILGSRGKGNVGHFEGALGRFENVWLQLCGRRRDGATPTQ